MLKIALAIVSFGVVAVLLLTLDYLDHKTYSEKDEAIEYGLFLALITRRSVSILALITPIVLLYEITKDQLFMLIVSAIILFVFYMNVYNFISFPERALMIISSEIEGVSNKLPVRFYFLHPSIWLRSLTEDNIYVYSLNSERSLVLRFAEEEAYNFAKQFTVKRDSKCHCCPKQDCPVTRVRGKKSGYTGYNIASMEYGETSFGVASTINVNLCEECWSNYKKLLIQSDLVDEAELLTDVI